VCTNTRCEPEVTGVGKYNNFWPALVTGRSNQPKGWGRRRLSVCLAIPALTASRGSVTDTLNFNWDCAYADFPSRLKTPTWANRGPLLKRQYALWEGIILAGRLSGRYCPLRSLYIALSTSPTAVSIPGTPV